MDGQVPEIPAVPPMSQNNTHHAKTFLSQRLVILAGAVLLLLLIPGLAFISNKGAKKEVSPAPLPSSVPTPKVEKVKVLPKNTSFQPSIFEYDFAGIAKVRQPGVISQVVEAGKSYRVDQDLGPTITANIDNKTLLASGWFEVKDGVVVGGGSDIISLDEFVRKAKAGTRVEVTYVKDKLVSGTVLIDEFVLYD